MRTLILIVSLFLTCSAFAQSRIVSLDAYDFSYVGGLVFRHDNGKNANRNETDFRLKLNYAQSMEEYVGVMWKVAVDFERLNRDFGSSDSFQSSYGLRGGFLFNFDAEKIKDSFFTGVMVGAERMTLDYPGVKSKSGFNVLLDLEAGKRWDLGQYSVANISYAPSVAVAFKRYGGGLRDDYFKNGNEVRFNYLKFDILF